MAVQPVPVKNETLEVEEVLQLAKTSEERRLEEGGADGGEEEEEKSRTKLSCR